MTTYLTGKASLGDITGREERITKIMINSHINYGLNATGHVQDIRIGRV